MPDEPRSALPQPLAETLSQFGEALAPGKVRRDLLAKINAGLAGLPPAVVPRAAPEIARRARLYHLAQRNPPFLSFRLRPSSDLDLLAEHPELSLLFLFHHNGYVREAALKSFEEGAATPAVFAALALRLNDWAEPVRKAAAACAARVFPRTDASVIAPAALDLLERLPHWRRWHALGTVLTDALSRDDVIAALAGLFRTGRAGPMMSLLRRIVHVPAMDSHLAALADRAVLPGVRALALSALIDGKVTWRVDSKYEWQNPWHSGGRYVDVFAERQIIRPAPLETLVLDAAGNRYASIRKVAADGLVRHWRVLANRDAVIALLDGDKSRTIRERIDFVKRSIVKDAAGSP